MRMAWYRFALASACALLTAFPRALAAFRLAIVPFLLCALVQPAEAASATAQPSADGAMAGMDGDDGPVWAATTAFSFVDPAGKPVTDAAFHGRFLLLHLNDGPCASACTARRAGIAATVAALGDAPVAAVSVTGEAAPAPAPVVALSGSADALRKALDGYGVRPGEMPAGGVLLLDDPDGHFVVRLDERLDPAALAAAIRRILGAHVTYIGIDTVDWDYDPIQADGLTGTVLTPAQQLYVYNAPDRIGSKYEKILYREYADGSFSRLKPRPPEWVHLGLLGPVLRGEVGDVLRIVVRNDSASPHGLHPHGVFYSKAFEGAHYDDGGHGPRGLIPPGGTYTYLWEIPERAGPGPADPSSIAWPYHGHDHEGTDENSGLIGAIIVTRRGMAGPTGRPKDVDREFVTLWKIFDENASELFDDNVARFTEPGMTPGSGSADGDDRNAQGPAADWVESNLKHAINGYIFGTLPGLVMREGERVRWYLIGMGSTDDNHTPHWHGNTAIWYGRRVDTIGVMPATSTVADMVPDDPGTWMFHCHVIDHFSAGMTATYTVLPKDAPWPDDLNPPGVRRFEALTGERAAPGSGEAAPVNRSDAEPAGRPTLLARLADFVLGPPPATDAFGPICRGAAAADR